MIKLSLISALLLTACVTINIYFPAAAAEHVADEIIKEIQSEDKAPLEPKDSLEPQVSYKPVPSVLFNVIEMVLNTVISPANAAADLTVNTPEIRKLRSAMQSRFSALKPFYANGLIGIKSDGFIVLRSAAPLKIRNKVNKLIAAENKNRQSLYQAIANANGHPEWFAQIKSTFAARWISNAQSGWWYQTSKGNWKKK